VQLAAANSGRTLSATRHSHIDGVLIAATRPIRQKGEIMARTQILIDDEVLQRNLQAFLRKPAGSAVRDSFDTPLWLCLVGGMMLFCAGMCMLPTIVWTLAGAQVLWGLLKFDFLKPAWENPSRNPELLRPLVGYGIIIGPSGKFALVVGTFRPSREYSSVQLEQGQRTSSCSQQEVCEELVVPAG
jgi:hypothetical protein